MGKQYKTEKDLARLDQESNESKDTVVDVHAPSSRFQEKQQVAKSDEALDTKTPISSFSIKKERAKGGQLKQEVAASVMTDNSGFSGDPTPESLSVGQVARAGLRSMSYSGDAGTILGSTASTPIVAQPSRGDGRFDKRLDATNKKINYLASEQVLVEYDNPKPLADNESVQGYNGTPKNNSARTQKTNGYSNAELLYDRSVDEISRDMIFFTSGQVVKQSGLTYNDAPTITDRYNSETGATTHAAFNLTRGNYSPRNLAITITKDNTGTYVSSFNTVVDDLSCNAETYNVVNSASDNEVIDVNRAEIDRQNIDAKAGRETQLDWSPLGRAIPQPTATVGYLRDLESMMGSEIFTCYKFANKAMAYQLNKAAKDGQNTVGPKNEMLLGLIAKHNWSDDFNADSILSDPFSSAAEAAGAPSLLIDIFDSKTKYKNKADVLTQPRSLKMHIQTADNNMNFMRLKPEFVAALNAQDVFSTIDRGYDPMSPVCITDCVRLVHPFNWSDQFNYTQTRNNDGVVVRTWGSTLFAYSYSNRSSRYLIKVTNPLVAGIAYFIEQHAGDIYAKIAGTGNGTQDLIIPIVHSTRYFSLWDFLVLAATPYIQYERTNAMKDVLDFETNFEYPFSQLKPIKELNPMNAVNYTMRASTEPLESHEMLPSTAITWIMPEVFWRSSSNKVIAPWYFNEDQYQFSAAFTANLSQWNGAMSMPVIRSGVRLSFLDDLYSMSERDVRLCLDRLIRLPYDNGYSTNNMFIYKYSQSSEGIPGFTTSDNQLKSYWPILTTPRELGWFAVAPGDFCRYAGVLSDNDNICTANHRYITNLSTTLVSTSYRIRCWKAAYNVCAPVAALAASSVLVDRAQSFTQRWVEHLGYEINGTLENGADTNQMVLSIHDVIHLETNASTIYGATNDVIVIPFTDGYSAGATATNAGAQGVATGDVYTILGLNKALWTRIQKLPFVISPFDTCKLSKVDPFDVAYIFNLAGFMESDYNEDIYNRLNQKQNQGWLYVDSPFVKASPVFKDAARTTEVAI